MNSRIFLIIALTSTFGLVTSTQAADDPSIEAALRLTIQQSMLEFIEGHSEKGVLRLYDPVEGILLRLAEPNLHQGIVKKGDFFVSCADFVDQRGRRIDIDLLSVDVQGDLRIQQAIVHKIDGTKRPYDVESR